MKARQLPTFREFLQENKKVIVDDVPWLALVAVLTLVLWHYETTSSLSWYLVPLPFPRHWIGEWIFFAQMGAFLASARKTIIPPWMMIATVQCLGILVVSYFQGFGLVTGAVLTLLITAPLPFCFTLQKVLIWRKTLRK